MARCTMCGRGFGLLESKAFCHRCGAKFHFKCASKCITQKPGLFSTKLVFVCPECGNVERAHPKIAAMRGL